ncbi:MAG: peptidylprolyl isomerase [Albidovulum sp.]|uniref:peptidylprolyl isomerase n=1 Tax=Albidovulum sp. TaxID=1872424 RepID=UPI0013245D55|nr:peptidylprolyl isomerase [Defluviimonas sp.]KAB2881924.1 MAG: peptidylprolyl isomerase [Defluviimonas sp.]
MRITTLIPLALAGLTALAAPSVAQSGQFSPVVVVNDSAVTRYELDQRVQFLTMLRAPGDPVAEAEKGLIEDRLRIAAAKAAGITINDQQIAAGMAEFAGRANLDTEQFLQAIGQGGVAPETFRDFVAAGLAWREAVRARFLPKVAISEAEIDRALSVPAQRGAGPRVNLSEILIPTSGGTAMEKRDFAEELAKSIGSEAAFAAAARQHSAAPSRLNGGQVGWIPVTNLPPQVRQVIAGMGNGQVSPPINLGNAIAIVRLRGIEQGGEISAGNLTVDYAQVLLPGGRSPETLAESERIRGEVDTCDDLYRVFSGAPAGTVRRETRALAQVPADIAGELARLDDNEVSTALTSGGGLVFLMLCRRSATLAAGPAPSAADLAAPAADGVPAIDPTLGFGQGPNRAQVREELTNQRLAALADGWLAELRANAIIRTP